VEIVQRTHAVASDAADTVRILERMAVRKSTPDLVAKTPPRLAGMGQRNPRRRGRLKRCDEMPLFAGSLRLDLSSKESLHRRVNKKAARLEAKVQHPTTLHSPTTGIREHGGVLLAFDSYLARQARSPGTSRKYGEALAYNRWLNGRAPGTVEANEIDCYLEHWRQDFQRRHRRPPASASYRAQINALRAFYAYLDRFDLISDCHDRNGQPLPDPMRKILPPKSEPVANDWLRPAEDQALLQCDGSLQERFLVALLRWSGLRVSEATNLALADLDLTPGQQALTVRTSKTPAGRRTIPLLPELQPLLEQWLNQLANYNLDAPPCRF
jgi:site-specific recombinase XerC